MSCNFFKAVSLGCFALFANCASAQVKIQTPSGDLNFRLIGRTSLDLGTYLGADDHAANRNNASVNDTRLGLVANFDSDWEAKVEICFANKGISFRDVYLKKSFDEGTKNFTIGNTFMPFGMKQKGLAYKFIETASCDAAFTPSRKMGISYNVMKPKYNFNIGIYSDGDVDDNKKLNSGYQFAAQALIRPIDENGTIFHLAVSPVLTHPSSSVSFGAKVPTCISSFSPVAASVNPYNYGRFEAQALFIARRFYFEGRFQMLSANCPDSQDVNGNWNDNNLKAHGLVAQASWLILGEQQNYNRKTGLAANSDPKSLEVLVRFAQTDFEDHGTENNLTLGVNYFFNKYVRSKINYVHYMIKDGANLDLIETRLQFSF